MIKVSDSYTEMTELVLPNDTNSLGNLLGGKLMFWIDICAAISAMRVTKIVCVTAGVDDLIFLAPIRLGDAVKLKAIVNRTFNSSLEVGVDVYAENMSTGEIRHSNSAYLTFVCVDKQGKPIPVPEVSPISPDEKRKFDGALHRREERLRKKEILQRQSS
ncbi:MAG: acyl-CoA thioesterase [Ignavibacteria bacterium]|nr:acyl-CoA thioesterase [Ignavibacteria bacterium]